MTKHLSKALECDKAKEVFISELRNNLEKIFLEDHTDFDLDKFCEYLDRHVVLEETK